MSVFAYRWLWVQVHGMLQDTSCIIGKASVLRNKSRNVEYGQDSGRLLDFVNNVHTAEPIEKLLKQQSISKPRRSVDIVTN